jgi:hypothetical protein
LIRVFDRAVFHAYGTARAFVFLDVSRLSVEGYLEIAFVPCNALYVSIRQYFYIRMPADLDQFGCEYSHAAVVGRKGLVQLGHMAADRGRPLDQIDLEPRGAEIEGGLNAADPSTDDQDVSEVAAFEALAKLLYLFILY